jgi:hypothetical protein
MKKALAIALLFVSASCLPAMAGDQQNKMKECAATYKAKGLPKSEYKSFMAECLKAGSNPEAMAPAKVDQKTKMKLCNEKANKEAPKGDARKAFMKACLSK